MSKLTCREMYSPFTSLIVCQSIELSRQHVMILFPMKSLCHNSRWCFCSCFNSVCFILSMHVCAFFFYSCTVFLLQNALNRTANSNHKQLKCVPWYSWYPCRNVSMLPFLVIVQSVVPFLVGSRTVHNTCPCCSRMSESLIYTRYIASLRRN